MNGKIHLVVWFFRLLKFQIGVRPRIEEYTQVLPEGKALLLLKQ